jgi:hypothetical protein
MIWRRPELEACAEGVKVTLTEQEPLEGRLVPQVLVWAKSAVIVTAQTAEEVATLLVMVEESRELVVPTTWSGKGKDLGLRVREEARANS